MENFPQWKMDILCPTIEELDRRSGPKEIEVTVLAHLDYGFLPLTALLSV